MNVKNNEKENMRKGASLNADSSNIDRVCFGGGRRSFITMNEKHRPARAMKAIILVVQPNPILSINLWNRMG